MERILGIDTGTNSLGWAIVERDGDRCRLVDKGVSIFQEGVKEEKGIETSVAAERTQHRSVRTGYYRRKVRKVRLLRIMSDNGLCPPLSREQLSQWRQKKIYPDSELFMAWQMTDDKEEKNPYAYRHRCLHDRLDMEKQSDRYILGRALYHINQRRGFLSNRKDQSGDDDGTVKASIGDLSAKMKEAGCEFLGDYFHLLYNRGERIRKHYTARNEHYLAEFRAICSRQCLDGDLAKRLEHAIFDQRPLKSQKGLVGQCVFEKGKAKCPVSHPLYEEFRMLAFLNNVKVSVNHEPLRPLNADERSRVMPLFYRKTDFKFEDIAKKLAPKKQYAYMKDNPQMTWCFNYPMDTQVSCCAVTSRLKDIFGDDWLDAVCEVYTLSENRKDKTVKSRTQILNDVWHALFFFSDSDKLAEFAKTRLQLDGDGAKKFSEIRLPAGYASLSLKAIGKILPYLRRGMMYSHAVFMANMGAVMPRYEWSNPDMREVAIEKITDRMQAYDPKTAGTSLEQYVKDYLSAEYAVSAKDLEKLYHPSMTDVYPHRKPGENGIYQLGSPRISSVRNPMAMRSMFRLRKLVNRLLAEGRIDEHTTVNIEFARELNDANKRKAINADNRDNQKKHDEAEKQIVKLYKQETGRTIEPTKTDILKYLLWEEQGHRCIYTGKTIGLADFIGQNPRYDIEHTIPRSAGGDSTRMNLTLCDSRFNRDVKGTKLPSELANHDEIMQRIEDWKEHYENLNRQIRKINTRGATTKEAKDNLIQRRHKLTLQRDYWRGKYGRFTMTEVPEGFSRRQGTDISVISRYARLYLKSVFGNVYTVKGIATSDFRKIWGLQDIYSKKERMNHVHHCIDAIVIACIGRGEYAKLAQYYHDEENHRWYGTSKAAFTKPWPTFTEDLKNVENEILVSHYTPDNMHKQGNRHIRIGGQRVSAKGDAARGALHKDTCYGAIEVDGTVRYVQRKALADMEEKDMANIVDDTVRAIVMKAVAEKGFKEAVAGTIWMNEEKRVPINKVRCYAKKIANPLHIRHHRDVSRKEYKRQFHVANDTNYMMAVYIGKDKKGKMRRDFELVNMIDAANYYKASRNRESADYGLVPQKSTSGYPLAYTLKTGTMVLLYENTPEEVWNASKEELSRRLYKVKGLSTTRIKQKDKTYDYGSIMLIFHEEARKSDQLKAKNGEYKQDEPFRPLIAMLHTQLKALVQGYDFEINELGEITRKR